MNQGSQRNTAFQIITLLMFLVGLAYVVTRLKVTSLFPALTPEQITEIEQALLILWLISLGLWLVLLVTRLRSRRPSRRGRTTSLRQTRESTMQGQWRQPDINSTWASTHHDTRERITSSERHPSLVMPVPAIAIEPHRHHVSVTTSFTDWSVDLLQELEWRRFEDLCRSYFDTVGLDARPLDSAPDSAASLQLWKPGSTAMNAIACTIGGPAAIQVNRIRALQEARQRHQVQQAFLVGAGKFSSDAIAAGKDLGMILMDGPTLLKRILTLPPDQQEALLQLAVKGDFRSPTCPVCSRKMSLRSGDFKSFWRCTGYPECRCRMTPDGDGMLRS
ncbi:restriction endonuclease [Actimicrobium sp. CCC2.4]|uniref:restriction endonuclease n=1 Tax=Actimicrobium sp. CCC2.4 TaxID=3048606 RepID=UPI002AC9D287|nr:restriction endonuclease [Actimicrobium sp. CCC2.4]MEB0133898.1 restriction endonuclease [Actimicrobium sp. CCC2.4]WPX31438.1 restriction endonuclease [Actimicrobium sp. CCC2.4]